MNVQSYKKIYICLTGSGKIEVKRILQESKIPVLTYAETSKEEINECFSYKKILCEESKSLRRLQFIINDEKFVSNRNLKNYNILLFVENRILIPNNPAMISLKNSADYFIDYRATDGKIHNETEMRASVQQLLEVLLKNMR